MTPFLTLLRSLDAAASKAPWVDDVMPYNLRDGHPKVRCVTVGNGVELIHLVAPDATKASRDDVALIVALRNRAARIAAALEAAGALVNRLNVGAGHRMDRADKGAIDSLRAALAALDKEEA